jgi:hypothetical protein
MLRPLSAALAGWAPAPGGRSDPLGAIVAQWPALVGAGVAANARPVALSGDTLVVGVRSSGWSQQLSLLAPGIIASLRALPEGAAVERLRFRIVAPATARPRPGLGAAAAAAGLRAPRDLPPAASAAEALQRLREHASARRPAAGACTDCGGPHPGGGRCSPCDSSERQARAAAVQRLMYEAPWLGYDEIARLAGGVERDEYDRLRRALLARWWETLVVAERSKRATPHERRIASSYVLLQSGLDPERITPAVVRNLLGTQLAALLFS